MSHACAACGPGSLWGLPHPASQCALSRDGFDLWQDKLYLKCTGCNNKYGHDCLHKLSQKVHEYERSLSECRAAGFQQWTSGACATIPHCIDCEQGTIPEPAFSDAAQVIKASTADYDRRVVLLVPLADQLLSGDMAQLKRWTSSTRPTTGPPTCLPFRMASSIRTHGRRSLAATVSLGPRGRWRRGARGTPATGSRRRRTSSSSWRWRR